MYNTQRTAMNSAGLIRVIKHISVSSRRVTHSIWGPSRPPSGGRTHNKLPKMHINRVIDDLNMLTALKKLEVVYEQSLSL